MIACENTVLNSEPKMIKSEPVKAILENMDGILNEIGNTLNGIESAIFGPRSIESNTREPQDECMLDTLNRQRNKAEALLGTAIRIREGLW